MQDTEKENIDGNPELWDISPEEKRNLLGFFELLIRVDKRINPALYQQNNQNND